MRYSQWKAFHKHLHNAAPEHLSSLYLVVIEEEYERMLWMQQVAVAFAPHAFAMYTFSAKELSLVRLAEELQQRSLFVAAPLILVDGLHELSAEIQRAWVHFFSNLHVSAGALILGSAAKLNYAAVVERHGIVFDLSEEKIWEKEQRLKDQAIERVEKEQKKWAPGALEALFVRIEKKSAWVAQEVEKLLLFAQDRAEITSEDVQAISSSSLSYTLWQIAERMVWEKGWGGEEMEAGDLQGLIACLRTQMQLGVKIASLQQRSVQPSREHFPTIWPKVLEKRIQQTLQLGLGFFEKGLEVLFQVEWLSRSTSLSEKALLTLLRAKWSSYAKR